MNFLRFQSCELYNEKYFKLQWFEYESVVKTVYEGR